MTVERPTAFVSTGELPPPERVRMLTKDGGRRLNNTTREMQIVA